MIGKMISLNEEHVRQDGPESSSRFEVNTEIDGQNEATDTDIEEEYAQSMGFVALEFTQSETEQNQANIETQMDPLQLSTSHIQADATAFDPNAISYADEASTRSPMDSQVYEGVSISL